MMGNEPISRERTGHLNRASTSDLRNHGIPYGAAAPWGQSPRSSPRSGKPAAWRRGAGVFDDSNKEVRDMRNAETVLSVIRERGRQGLPLESVYRLLFNRDLFLLAYGRIAQNTGAMSPGTTAEVADGMSLAKIDAIIEALRFERYRWTPVRRTYIEKKHSTKKRPLGIPTWSDKLAQE